MNKEELKEQMKDSVNQFMSLSEMYNLQSKIDLLLDLHSDVYNHNAVFRALLRKRIAHLQNQLQKLKG